MLSSSSYEHPRRTGQCRRRTPHGHTLLQHRRLSPADHRLKLLSLLEKVDERAGEGDDLQKLSTLLQFPRSLGPGFLIGSFLAAPKTDSIIQPFKECTHRLGQDRLMKLASDGHSEVFRQEAMPPPPNPPERLPSSMEGVRRSHHFLIRAI